MNEVERQADLIHWQRRGWSRHSLVFHSRIETSAPPQYLSTAYMPRLVRGQAAACRLGVVQRSFKFLSFNDSMCNSEISLIASG